VLGHEIRRPPAVAVEHRGHDRGVLVLGHPDGGVVLERGEPVAVAALPEHVQDLDQDLVAAGRVDGAVQLPVVVQVGDRVVAVGLVVAELPDPGPLLRGGLGGREGGRATATLRPSCGAAG
jgi:hypothetical protein